MNCFREYSSHAYASVFSFAPFYLMFVVGLGQNRLFSNVAADVNFYGQLA